MPVALSTDDEGVSRIDITHEYVRAAIDYHLTYADVKTLARTGMEHNFLPGASLWAQPDEFNATVDRVQGAMLGRAKSLGRVQGVSGWERKGGRAVGAGAALQGVRGEVVGPRSSPLGLGRLSLVELFQRA